MEKSTIEIKMTNQETYEIVEICFSTEDIKLFSELQDKLVEMLSEESENGDC